MTKEQYYKYRKYQDNYCKEYCKNHYARVTLMLRPGEKDLIRQAALKSCTSMNAYINEAIAYRMCNEVNAYYTPSGYRIHRDGRSDNMVNDAFTLRMYKDDFPMLTQMAYSQSMTTNLYIVEAIYEKMKLDGVKIPSDFYA